MYRSGPQIGMAVWSRGPVKPRHRRPPTTLAFVLLAMALTVAPFGGTKRDSHAGRDSGTALAPTGQPLGQAALTSGSEYDGLAGATSWAGERIAGRRRRGGRMSSPFSLVRPLVLITTSSSGPTPFHCRLCNKGTEPARPGGCEW